jgi:hypothetical protein
VEVHGPLDGESGVHRSDLPGVALPVRVGDDLGEDREEEEEEETEHDADGGGRVPHGRRDTEAEHRDQPEVEDRAGGLRAASSRPT